MCDYNEVSGRRGYCIQNKIYIYIGYKRSTNMYYIVLTTQATITTYMYYLYYCIQFYRLPTKRSYAGDTAKHVVNILHGHKAYCKYSKSSRTTAKSPDTVCVLLWFHQVVTLLFKHHTSHSQQHSPMFTLQSKKAIVLQPPDLITLFGFYDITGSYSIMAIEYVVGFTQV